MSDEKSKLTEVVEEAKENARRDRKRLENLSEKLIEMATGKPLLDDESGDPSALIIAEGLTKLTEALTRTNAQMVELAKIELKREFIRKSKRSGDNDELFDEIQGDGDSSLNN